jgi:hypothetical protein
MRIPSNGFSIEPPATIVYLGEVDGEPGIVVWAPMRLISLSALAPGRARAVALADDLLQASNGHPYIALGSAPAADTVKKLAEEGRPATNEEATNILRMF